MEHGPRVVIVGAGFGGLSATRTLAKKPVDVTLIDRNNYHTFYPLLYQVGAAELEPEAIVYPIRKVQRGWRNVRFVMDEVKWVDPNNKTLECRRGSVPYDFLLLASGSRPNFFGVSEAAQNAFPLRTVEDGMRVRNHILSCYEAATRESSATRRKPLLTFIIVGGGPTGVEFAGALAELINGPLAKDHPDIDQGEISLILLEAGDGLLGGMSTKLSDYAAERLQRKKVDVRLSTLASSVSADAVRLKDGDLIPTNTVIWTAGVQASQLAELSGLPVNQRGQVNVQSTLQVNGAPGVYAIGDSAVIADNESVLPLTAPVAMQQGKTAAQNIIREINGETPQAFRFKDRGMLVVIGRNRAVAQLPWLELTGPLAWLMWAGVHLFGIIGFRNRLLVLVNWAIAYLSMERPVRLILPANFSARAVASDDEAQNNGPVRKQRESCSST